MPDEPIEPVVDMDAYDAAMKAAGFEYPDDEEPGADTVDVWLLGRRGGQAGDEDEET